MYKYKNTNIFYQVTLLFSLFFNSILFISPLYINYTNISINISITKANQKQASLKEPS